MTIGMKLLVRNNITNPKILKKVKHLIGEEGIVTSFNIHSKYEENRLSKDN
jgi:hypothetical protein